MDRITNLDPTLVSSHRAAQQTAYPDASEPAPGTYLKQDDDVSWLGMPFRLLWGSSEAREPMAYSPDFYGEYAVPILIDYIEDRAPADPNESPFPLWPTPPANQQLAQAPNVRDAVKGKGKTPTTEQVRAALDKTLSALPEDARKEAEKRIRKVHPDAFKGR